MEYQPGPSISTGAPSRATAGNASKAQDERRAKPAGEDEQMTNEQREVMRHALGLNRGSREYRNHFVTGPGTTDYPHCEALVAAGLMTRRDGNQLSGGDQIYSVTDAGRAALKTPNGNVSGAL